MKFVLASYGTRVTSSPCRRRPELQRRGHEVRMVVPPDRLPSPSRRVHHVSLRVGILHGRDLYREFSGIFGKF